MTPRQMVELVQLHHPGVPAGVILTLINEKRKEFADRSELIKGYVDFQTAEDTIYYALPSRVLEVIRVDYDGNRINRETPTPSGNNDTSLLSPVTGE
jgi:hypothetical protein